MRGFYNIVVTFLNFLMRQVQKGHLLFVKEGSKTHRFILGQKDLLPHIATSMRDETRPVCWIHASSMGEYAVARPIILQLQKQGFAVVLTFFSSTGYEALHHKRGTADYIFYMPFDTRKNVRNFLDTVKPERTVFIISEYWINYLSELKRRQIPTFLISALIPNTSYLLKWYAWPLRKALKAITMFTVSDERSKENLHKMGFDNCRVVGDPLFDNAINIAKTDYHNEVIEHFCANSNNVFIAGSINDENDRTIVTGLANAERDTKFIMVPHEISDASIDNIISRCKGRTLRYAECDKNTDFTDVQTLIIDYVGDLSRLYRYGHYAYVGGGFTRYLHSVIEPVVYGLPVAFGPNIHRKATPQQMIDLGIGAIVLNADELRQWLVGIRANDHQDTCRKAVQYAEQNGGATDKIVNIITG